MPIVCQNLRYWILKRARGFARYLLVGGRNKNIFISSVIKQQILRIPLSGRGRAGAREAISAAK